MRDLQGILKEAQTLVMREMVDVSFITDEHKALYAECDKYLRNTDVSAEDFNTLLFIRLKLDTVREVTDRIRDTLRHEAAKILNEFYDLSHELSDKQKKEAKS